MQVLACVLPMHACCNRADNKLVPISLPPDFSQLFRCTQDNQGCVSARKGNGCLGTTNIAFRDVTSPTARMQVGSVIGKAGAIVKQIRDETGARIRVVEGVPNCDERVIVISGRVDPGRHTDSAQVGDSPRLVMNL